MKDLQQRLEAKLDKDAIKKHYTSQVDAFIDAEDKLIPLVVKLAAALALSHDKIKDLDRINGLSKSCFTLNKVEEALQALEEYLK